MFACCQCDRDTLSSNRTMFHKSISAKDTPPPSYTEATRMRPLKFYPNDGSVSHSKMKKETVYVDECIAHLKLMSVFSDLRNVISSRDGLFDLWDNAIAESNDEMRKQSLALLREKRWELYVSRAVDRFETWLDKCVPHKRIQSNVQQLTVRDIERSDFSITERQARHPWTPETLPPIDVIMVWHSYMLNPHDFLEDCLRYQRVWFWSAGFPWAQINDCIRPTFDYAPPPKTAANFENQTGRSWDNEDDFPFKVLACPCCRSELQIPWSTSKGPGNLIHPFKDGKGFADGKLEYSCPNCSYVVTHDILRIAKFRDDVKALFAKNIPMPGTLLSSSGLIQPTPTLPVHTFANHYITKGFNYEKMMAVTDFVKDPRLTMNNVRTLFMEISQDRDTLRFVGGYHRTPQRIAQLRRMSIRKMMSRYWENSSPFALDLVGAVLRQGSFVSKMDELDWLNSPAVDKTMARLIAKYKIFMEIIARNAGRMAVPTLDVDLAWHTHQLSPFRYYLFCESHTDSLINHDDKVEEGKLSDSFEWTSKEYQRLTGGHLYSTCTCWYCEAVHESTLPSSEPKLFKFTASSKAIDNELALHSEKNPDRGVHISSHNSILPKGVSRDEYRQLRLKNQFQKISRRLKKRGIDIAIENLKDSKTKHEGVSYDAELMRWGILPVYLPFFAPYMSDIDISNNNSMYAKNPACANFSPGAVGNCVSGTCSGRISAGACNTGECGGGSVGGYASCSSMGGCSSGSKCGGGCGGRAGAVGLTG